jgi:hypothetical protein
MEGLLMRAISRRRPKAKAIDAIPASPEVTLPLRMAAFLVLSAISAVLLALPYVAAQ